VKVADRSDENHPATVDPDVSALLLNALDRVVISSTERASPGNRE
jgi:hypothetical protein